MAAPLLCRSPACDASPGYGKGSNPLQGRLAELLEVDVAAWWRPTSENFFDRVSKATLLAILDDVGGLAPDGRYGTSKKGEVSGSCQTLFAGQAISEPEVKERALAWLPKAMRFGVAVVNAIDRRARCLANLELRRRKIADGVRIRLASPMTFTDGHVGDEFTVRVRGRALVFVAPMSADKVKCSDANLGANFRHRNGLHCPPNDTLFPSLG